MATFTDQQPIQRLAAPRTMSNSPWLKYLGYNNDGTRNTFGTVLSWIPGVNLGTNAIAQGIEKGTDSQQQTLGYQKGNLDKTMVDLQIASLIAGGIGAAGGAAGGAAASGSIGADSAAGVASNSAAGLPAGFQPFDVASDAMQPSTGLSSASSADAINGATSMAGNSGGNNWLDIAKKATKVVGKGSPIDDLTSGADNNNYTWKPQTSIIQNYNG